MILLFSGLLALSVAGAAPPDGPFVPSVAGGGQPVQVERARQTSATRLRGMLGAHSKGPPLLRPEVVDAVDPRHPKVRAVLQAVDAARAARFGALWYDLKLENDTKIAAFGYYGYTVSDTSVTSMLGPVDVSAGYRIGLDANSDRKIPSYYGELDTLAGGEVRLEVGVDLLQGFLVDAERAELQRSNLGIDLAEADLRLTERVVSRDAVVAWAKWVSNGRILTLDESLLAVAQQRQQAVDQRIELGDLAQIERVRNRQFLASREADLAGAQGEFAAATEKLALYLRASDGSVVRASRDRLPDRDSAPDGAPAYSQDPVELARASHPLLRAARASLDMTQVDLRLARNRVAPELRITGAISQDLDGSGSVDDSTLEPTLGVIGAKVKLPVLNFKDRGKRRAAQAKRDKAIADLVWLEDQVVADVNAALAQEQAMLTRWRRSAESVELALELQEAEQRRFDVGDIDLLRLWQIEQQTAKAIRTEVKAWAAYQIAVADLELAVGVPLEL